MQFGAIFLLLCATTQLDAAPKAKIPEAAPAPQLAGWYDWPECNGRAYKRALSVAADGTFLADDVPHPCKQECVVQHSLRRSGRWKLSGRAPRTIVTLTVTETSDSSGSEAIAAKSLPATLIYDAAKKRLGELATGADQTKTCWLEKTAD